MTTALHFLCAGAAQGLVKALQAQFCALHGVTLEGRFGAVGAMKEALLAGEPCDLMIVTESMIDALCASGDLRPDTRAPLGKVRTGIAVRAGEMRPAVDTPEALKSALVGAEGIYFPDPLRATAGIHFANVMRELGVHDLLRPRFRTYPAGAIAMRELAASSGPRLMGCTQVSEILYTEGVALVAPLPQRFELATVYTAAVGARSAQPALAAAFIDLIAGAGAKPLRAAGGFDT